MEGVKPVKAIFLVWTKIIANIVRNFFLNNPGLSI